MSIRAFCPRSVAIVLQKSPELCELCNIATAPEHRGNGYATKLIHHLLKLYRPRCKQMEVGTDPSMVPFYEKFGFEYSYTKANFFKDNYHPPIIQDGRPLTDMHILTKPL